MQKGDRRYKIGNKLTTIGKPLIGKIMAWSTYPFNEQNDLDKRLVEALLIACVGSKSINVGLEVEGEVIDFIKGISINSLHI